DRFAMQLAEAGRYRLLVELGEHPGLRLLPQRETSAGPQAASCRPWNGEPLNVTVGEVFAEGQLLRDAYSGQQARVKDGRIELTPAPASGGLLLLEAAEAAPQTAHDWRNASVYFVITDRF